MPEAAATKTYKCRHIFADGHRCGAKCLRHQEFCFYHHTTRRPASSSFPKAAPATPAETTFDLPLPEDRTAIQLSIGEVLRRIAANQIDPRRAGLLLYGLQIASLNLPAEPRRTAERSHNPRTRGRRLRDQAPEPEESIEAYDLDPTLGPLAPIAEYADPEEELSFGGQLLQEMDEAPEAPSITLPTLNACHDTCAPSLAAPSPRVRSQRRACRKTRSNPRSMLTRKPGSLSARAYIPAASAQAYPPPIHYPSKCDERNTCSSQDIRQGNHHADSLHNPLPSSPLGTCLSVRADRSTLAPEDAGTL